jgi:hypothetical protein
MRLPSNIGHVKTERKAIYALDVSTTAKLIAIEMLDSMVTRTRDLASITGFSSPTIRRAKAALRAAGWKLMRPLKSERLNPPDPLKSERLTTRSNLSDPLKSERHLCIDTSNTDSETPTQSPTSQEDKQQQAQESLRSDSNPTTEWDGNSIIECDKPEQGRAAAVSKLDRQPILIQQLSKLIKADPREHYGVLVLKRALDKLDQDQTSGRIIHSPPAMLRAICDRMAREPKPVIPWGATVLSDGTIVSRW